MASTTSWILLLLAGLLEVAWTIGMKYSHGFTKLGPTLFTVVSLALSMCLLARVVDEIPLGTAYGIWVGIGAVGAAVAGMVLFQEEATPTRLLFLGLLLISLVGLKVSAK